MIHKIWMALFIIGIAYSFFSGRIADVNQAVISGSSAAVTLVFSLAGILIFWTGILQLANKAIMLDLLAVILRPVTKILYPRLAKDHQAQKYLTTNMISNLLGLSSVATGAGIKAIHALQETNPDQTKPSFEMYTLLVVNTAGLALIPTTIITLRSTFNAINPTDVYAPIILTASISLIIGLAIHSVWSRVKKVQSSGDRGSNELSLMRPKGVNKETTIALSTASSRRRRDIEATDSKGVRGTR